jgi:low temperature requirement protein LtrA
LWALAIALDFGGPLLFGSTGWKLVPGHFAERHGLIIIIALGESIVAIGVAADTAGVVADVVAVSVLGVFQAAALWWVYFDVTAVAAEHRLSEAEPGQEQNEMARDGYSILHLVMVAGIVLVALGLKKTVAHPTDALAVEIASALCGGAALYLLGHVLFRWRMTHTVARERLGVAVLLVALVPVATAVPAWVSLLAVTVVVAVLVGYETTAWAETRDRIRHPGAQET